MHCTQFTGRVGDDLELAAGRHLVDGHLGHAFHVLGGRVFLADDLGRRHGFRRQRANGRLVHVEFRIGRHEAGDLGFRTKAAPRTSDSPRP